MKSLKYIIAGFCLAALPGMEAMAQEVVKVDDPWKDYPDKKTLYKDYSRWSIGVNIGMPFYAGDFRSVSRGNNNWAGYMFGLQGSYQFNPIFGGTPLCGLRKQPRRFATLRGRLRTAAQRKHLL